MSFSLSDRAAALRVLIFSLSLASLATAQQGPAGAPAQSSAPTATAAPASAPAATAPASASASASTSAPALASYTDLLKPALSNLYGTLADLKLEKWKNGNVRTEAEHDTASIVDDLNQKVPDLLKDADAAPARIDAAMPLARNFAALYDVSLRVLDAARIAAPADQAAKIQEALNGLAAANRALYDRLEQAAKAQQVQIGDLETRIKVQQEAAAHPLVAAAPPPPPCPVPAKKPAAKRKPATTAQSSGTSGTSGSGAAQPQKPQN